MVRRLMKGGHGAWCTTQTPEAVQALAAEGADRRGSLEATGGAGSRRAPSG